MPLLNTVTGGLDDCRSAGIYAGKKLYGAWKNRNKGKRDFVDDDLMLERDFLDALADVIISYVVISPVSDICGCLFG